MSPTPIVRRHVSGTPATGVTVAAQPGGMVGTETVTEPV